MKAWCAIEAEFTGLFNTSGQLFGHLIGREAIFKGIHIGSNLSGMDNPYYGIISPGQSMPYVMSHDNNYLWSGDREQAHALLLTREGIPIVYTDGYNQSGSPDWFPKPAEIPFLGQGVTDQIDIVSPPQIKTV